MKDTTATNQSFSQKQNGKIFSIILLVIGILCIAAAVKHSFYPTKDTFRDDDYSPVTGILKKGPEEVSYRGNRHVKLVLDKYPETDFDIRSDVLKAASRAVMNIDSADTVTVMLEKDDAQLLLSGKHNDDCRVYGLYKNKVAYISLDDYRRAAEHNRMPAFLSWLPGILMVTVGLYSLYKAYRQVKVAGRS